MQAACEQAELRPHSLMENPPVTEMHLTLLCMEPEIFIPSSSFLPRLPERDPTGALGSQQHSAGFRRWQGKGSRRAAPRLRSSASPQTAVTVHKSVCLCFSVQNGENVFVWLFFFLLPLNLYLFCLARASAFYKRILTAHLCSYQRRYRSC